MENLLVALDASAAVVEEAVSRGCDVLLTHHPLLFRPLSRLREDDPVGGRVLRLARAGVALYALHTNLDAASGGLCDLAVEALGVVGAEPLVRPTAGRRKLVGFVPPENLEDVAAAVFAAGAGRIGEYAGCSFRTAGEGTFTPLVGAVPYVGERGRSEKVEEVRWETVVPEGRVAAVVEAFLSAHPYEEPAFDVYPLENVLTTGGAGRVGGLHQALRLQTLADFAQDLFGGPVRYAGDAERNVRTVAVVTGSGSSFIEQAAGRADVLVTGDLKYHDAERALNQGLCLVSVEHEALEAWALERWASRLAKELAPSGVRVRYAESDAGPWVGAADRVSVDVLSGEEGVYSLWADGGSRGNPGPSAIGVVLEDPQGRVIEERGAVIGRATNNVAEYRALLTGLTLAREFGVRRLRVFIDSELVARHLSGQYRVKNEQLRPLYEEVKRLMAGFDSAEIQHVPRGQNTRADALVNKALDA
ncbi:MAG: hypothetical protein Kow00129_17310 [Thermoleophilia bacterium]